MKCQDSFLTPLSLSVLMGVRLGGTESKELVFSSPERREASQEKDHIEKKTNTRTQESSTQRAGQILRALGVGQRVGSPRRQSVNVRVAASLMRG